MTTIAYRDGVIAADTCMINGYNITPRGIRKIAANHACLAGAAGMATYVGSFLKWFDDGEVGEPPAATKDDGNFDTGLIVRPDGSLQMFQPGGSYVITPPYYAIGSGRDHAFGAFFVGANAEMAVRAAIEHDTGTFGDVEVLRTVGALVVAA